MEKTVLLILRISPFRVWNARPDGLDDFADAPERLTRERGQEAVSVRPRMVVQVDHLPAVLLDEFVLR